MHGHVVDPSGSPIGNRLVSNGLDVAVTHADGRWQLPDGEQPFVWVHRGGGFDCADWYRATESLDDDVEIVFEMSAWPTWRISTRAIRCWLVGLVAAALPPARVRWHHVEGRDQSIMLFDYRPRSRADRGLERHCDRADSRRLCVVRWPRLIGA